jgi:hypothetical protein
MIIISPWSKKLLDGRLSPKCPTEEWWKKLLVQIDEPIIQVGMLGEIALVDDVRFNMPLEKLAKLVDECRIWISVDSFFQHFAWDRKKYGIVIFSQSNPKIFGHPENINLLKGPEYLMPNQFLFWDLVSYREDAFIEPTEVLKYL